MAPKKLTDADKQAILALYRQPQETTSTLAERYSVSNSTISRLLKANLPKAEYTDLIQKKRQISSASGDGPKDTPRRRTRSRVAVPAPEPVPDLESVPAPEPVPAPVAVESVAPTDEPTSTVEAPKRRRRRVSRTSQPPAETTEETTSEAAQLTLDQLSPVAPAPAETGADGEAEDSDAENGNDLAAAWVGEDLDSGDDWDDSDDSDDEDADDPDEGDGDEGQDSGDATPHLQTVEISPLTADVLSGPCYLVVERSSAELVVLPLRVFAELGQIPEAESEARTLAVFDNHRVARRFSRRNQRVIKVPNSGIIHATRPYLEAKGITRLLVDGQVYAIGEADDAPAVEDAGVSF